MTASALLRPILGLCAAAACLLPLPAAAQGLSGAYLAAEHAARTGDVETAAKRFAEVLARDPENTELLRRAMLHQVAAGRISQAMALARRMEQIEPGTHLARLLLAVDAMRRGEPGEAVGFFNEEDDIQNAFVGLLVAAWAAFGDDDPEAARQLLLEMEAEEIGGPAGRFVATYHLGLMEAALGDDIDAEAALARAAEQAGIGGSRLVRVRAGVLARLGRMEEARAVVDDYLARTLADPRLEALAEDLANGIPPAPVVTTAEEGLAEALYGVARFLVGRNRLIGLTHARLAVQLWPELVEAKLLIGNELRLSGQHALAIEAYESVPTTAPEALDARIGAALAHEASGDVDRAVAALRDTVATWPEMLEAHTALGDVLRRNERFAEAAAAYDGAIALVGPLENRHWPLLYQRGIAYERSDQWPLAEDDFLKALELEPDQPQVLNYLGYSWVELRKNLEEAEQMIEKAVEQRPDDGYIVDSLGWVLFRLGDFEGAVEHLERAVELRPVDPTINDHLGDALWMVGRRFEAEFHWKRALSFDPEEEVETRIRRKLDVGLDTVLAEEEAAGNPAIIGRSDKTAGDGEDGG